MRILLDECVNPRVKQLLEPYYTVLTVVECGWGGLPDNVLLKHLQGSCDVFLTIDQGFEHEHNLALLDFGIVIAHVPKNRTLYYKAISDEIYQAVSRVGLGEVVHVGGER